MPNRILREGILGSERVSRLKWPEEVFYRRLMSVVDDYGRTEANSQLLRSRCYPLQTDAVRNTDIPRWLAACEKAGLLSVYTVGGKQYVQIQNFRQQTRTDSKFPAPPASATQKLDDASISVANAHLGEGGVGGGDEGDTPTGPQGGDGAADTPFERFWTAYPLKVGKGVARKSFDRVKGVSVDDLIAAVGRQSQTHDWTKDNGRFIPHPSTWLNQGRWQDEGRAPVSFRKRRFDKP